MSFVTGVHGKYSLIFIKRGFLSNEFRNEVFVVLFKPVNSINDDY
jgi:hypothetical protein